MAGVEKSETRGRADPECTNRIPQQTVNVVGRHTFAHSKNAPLSFRKRAEAVRRGKPHRVVGTFRNRRHGVGRQTVRRGVGREMVVRVLANSTAEGSGPHRPIMTLMNGIHVILCESVFLRVRLRANRAIAVAQMR